MFGLVIAYWAVGFYPFFWEPLGAVSENVVEQTTSGGLSFSRPGIAYTESTPKWVSDAIEDNTFELELNIHSYDAEQNGPARIFTLSADHYNRNLTIGQDAEDLVVRLRTPLTGPNGAPAFIVNNLFRNLGPHRIIVRVHPQNIRIATNGRSALDTPLPPHALSTWNPEYQVALGNEFSFQRPWRGEVESAVVRVRGQEFFYGINTLHVPTQYTAEPSVAQVKVLRFFSRPFRQRHLSDWTVNILGFLPFGCFLVTIGRKPTVLPIALFWCAALSLSIETGQFFFATRTPQFEDLILNTLGGGIGAWVGNKLRRCS